MTDLLPEALADALGIVVSDLRREWRKEMEIISAEGRAIIAELKAENAALLARLSEATQLEVDRLAEAARNIKDGAPGENGRDGVDGAPGRDADPVDPAEVERLVDARVAAAFATLPVPRDGKDVDPEAIAGMVAASVAEAVEKLPAPVDGKDGASVTEEDIAAALSAHPGTIDAAVARYIEANPLPTAKAGAAGRDGVDGKDGQNGRDGADGKDGRDGADGAPGRDGIDGKDGANGSDGSPGERGQDGLDGKEGIGLAGAFIDRCGNLLLTLSDGGVKPLGIVVGRDGRDGIDGKDGSPGPGLEDFAEELGEDGRTLIRNYQIGGSTKETRIVFPIVLDRGVWRDGDYQKGDGVTWGGSFWIAQRDTGDKPETSDAWRLAVKRGRDGKDGVLKQAAETAPIKLR